MAEPRKLIAFIVSSAATSCGSVLISYFSSLRARYFMVSHRISQYDGLQVCILAFILQMKTSSLFFLCDLPVLVLQLQRQQQYIVRFPGFFLISISRLNMVVMFVEPNGFFFHWKSRNSNAKQVFSQTLLF